MVTLIGAFCFVTPQNAFPQNVPPEMLSELWDFAQRLVGVEDCELLPQPTLEIRAFDMVKQMGRFYPHDNHIQLSPSAFHWKFPYHLYVLTHELVHAVLHESGRALADQQHCWMAEHETDLAIARWLSERYPFPASQGRTPLVEIATLDVRVMKTDTGCGRGEGWGKARSQ